MVNELKPCPFCGADVVHVESLAKSFDPPRVFHEYHHPKGECFLGGERRILARFTDDPEPRLRFVRGWNRRDSTPSAWSSEPITEPGRYLYARFGCVLGSLDFVTDQDFADAGLLQAEGFLLLGPIPDPSRVRDARS